MYRKLTGQASISEANVREAMADVRTSLLEADVHIDVVNSFCERVVSDAIGQHVTKSLAPGEEMVGIVHKRLIEFLGGTDDSLARLNQVGGMTTAGQPGSPSSEPGGASAAQLAGPPADLIMRTSPGPTVVMMCGLQGSGKTTTCGKLAAYLKKRGRSVMVAAADLQRPAAVEQLHTVADQVRNDLPGGSRVLFYGEPEKVAEYGKAVGVAVQVCRRAFDAARKAGVDVLILDTAGRLHVNDDLMAELKQVKTAVQPHHIFLVVDAMTGQDAVNSAKEFHARLEVDGIILTKFDSDTRGGAAISVKHVTGAPIRFIGTGEKLDAIEEFHAQRMAGRILGMGDVVALVEKAQEQVSEVEAKALNEKLAKGRMTMDDFLKQMKMLRRMGPMKQLLGLLPGVGSMLKDVNIDEKQLDRVEAMICSMTKKEREQPELLNNSRRKRIATGSGTRQEDVGQLVRQFEAVNTLTKKMAGMSGGDKARAVKEMSSGMGGMPGVGGLRLKGSSFSSSPKDRFKKRKR